MFALSTPLSKHRCLRRPGRSLLTPAPPNRPRPASAGTSAGRVLPPGCRSSRAPRWLNLGAALVAALALAAPAARPQTVPTFQFATNQYAVLENDGFVTVTVQLVGAEGAGFTVDYATQNGTAVTGMDYLEKTGTLVFSAGTTSRTFTVLILDNSVVNPDKTFLVRLSNPSAGAVLGASTNVVTIADNDATSDVVEFNVADYTVVEDADLAVVTVVRSGNKIMPVWVDYATVAGGTATPGEDYVEASGQLYFGPGQAMATFIVDLLDDLVYGEGDETVQLQLTNAIPTTAVNLGRAAATLTLQENDFIASTFLFLSTSFTANEGDGYGVATVTRAGSTLGVATVDYLTADGTATNGLDYIATNGTLTFTNGQRFATFRVRLIDDSVLEREETVGLVLSNATAGATISQTNATLVIADNDSAFQFSTLRYVTNENSVAALVTVTREGGLADEAAVRLYAVDAAVTNAALAGFDYTGLNSNLLFAPGQTFTNVAIPILDDFDVEDSELFVVYLSNAVAAVLGDFHESEVVILDNDTDAGTFEFVTSVVTSSPEYGDVLYVTVRRSGGTSGAVSVQVDQPYFVYDLCPGSTNANTGSDYTQGTNRLSWANNEGGDKTLAIRIVDDAEVELDEIVVLELLNATGGAQISASNSTIAGQILYDDQPPGAADRYFNLRSYLNPTPGANNPVYATLVYTNGPHNGKALIAGDFTSYNAVPRPRIVRTYFDGEIDTSFNPGYGADAFIDAMALQPDDKIVIGGGFFSFNRISRNGIARLNPDGSLDTTFDPGAGVDGIVMSVLVLPDGKIVLGGLFASVNGVPRRNLARLNADGSLDETFDPGSGPNGAVWTLAASSQTVLGSASADNAGSDPAEFTTNITVNASSGTLVVAYDFGNISDSLSIYSGSTLLRDTGWTNGYDVLTLPFGPGPDPTTTLTLVVNEGSGFLGAVWAFHAAVVVDNTETPILIGGEFTDIDGTARARVARLNPDGSVDSTFDPGFGADNTVYSLLALADGRLLIGGAFSTFNGLPWQGIARLTPGGAPDTIRFNPGTGFEGIVMAMAFQSDGKLVAGGDFTAYHGVPRRNMARLYPDGTLDTSFMDAYYNQSAGPDQFVQSLAIYPFAQTNTFTVSNLPPTVTVAADAVFIGGVFTRVGGGETIADELEQAHVARLVGGAIRPDGNLLGNVEFVADSFTVDERAGLVAVTLHRLNGFLGNIHLRYETVDGSALAGVDYETTSGEMFWEHCDSEPKTFFVSILDDDLIEGNKTFRIRLSPPYSTGIYQQGNPALGYQDTATVFILDNDFEHGALGFSGASYYAAENTSNAVITVTRTGGGVGAVSVRWAASNGTATTPADYRQPTSGTLQFVSGEMSKTFTIGIVDDTAKEFEETVLLRLFSPAGGAVLRPDATNAALVIMDNDYGPGSLSLLTNEFRVNETDGLATLAVRRTSGAAGTVSVDFLTATVTSNGWGYPNMDYRPTNGTLTFLAGETLKTFEVPLLNDVMVEGTETVLVLLTNVQGGASLGYQSNAWITIDDDDAYGRLGFAAAQFYVSETTPQITIAVSRIDGSSEEVSVDYAVFAGPGDTATTNVDFVPVHGTLVFAAGQTNQSFTVNLLDDGELEPYTYETVSIVLSNFAKAAPGRHAAATLVIVDDEALSAPAGTVNASFRSGLNGFVNAIALQNDTRIVVGGAFTAADGLVRNRIARLDVNGLVDTAFNPGAGLNGTVRALALQPDGKIVAVGDFTEPRGIERFQRDGTRDSSFNPGTGADNPVHAVAVDLDDGGILVGGAFLTINGVNRPYVALLRANGSVDPRFGTDFGRPDGPVYALAVQPDGKVLIGGTFTAVDDMPRARLARLNQDGSLDPGFLGADLGANGTVYALALQPDGRILVGGAFDQVDGAPRRGLARLHEDGSLDTAFMDGLEGANNTVFAIALQPDGAVLVSGNFTSFHGTERNRLTRLRADGSSDPTINFGTGANSYIAALVLQTDSQIMVGGGFTEFNGLPCNHLARIVGGATTGPGQVQFTQTHYTVDEPGLYAAITVRRVNGMTGTLTVHYATRDDTATAGLDYTGVTNTVQFLEGESLRTLYVPIVNDTDLEDDETLHLELSNPSAPETLGQPTTATLTIASDDGQIGFTAATLTVNENVPGGLAKIYVRRAFGTNNTASVSYATTTNGTATPNLDFAPVSGRLVFAPGEEYKFFTVPILNDALPEPPKTIGLALTDPAGTVSLGTAAATLNLVDDDMSPGVIGFVSATYAVMESEPRAHLTVIRTNGSSGVVTVRYTTVGGTATPDADFNLPSGFLTFGDGADVTTLELPIVSDAVWEGDETVQLRLSAPTGGAVLGPATNATLVIRDDEFPPGALDPRFDPGEGPAGLVRAVAAQADGKVLIGGAFTNVAGTNRNHVARLNADGTVDPAFDPGLGANAVVSGLGILADQRVVIVGAFTNVNTLPARHIARFLPTGEVDTNFNRSVNFNAGLNTLAVQADEKLVVGGSFTVPSPRVARLHNNGTVDPTFDPAGGPNGAVLSVGVHPSGPIVVGGSFSAVDGFARHRVARLRANGVLDQDFVPPEITNGIVYAVAIQPDLKVLIGGDFTEIGGQPLPRLARLNPNGSLDTAFVAGPDTNGINGTVYAIDLQADGKIFIGGDFTAVQGYSANRYARLDATGAWDPTFATGQGANYTVFDVAALDDGSLLIGGDFTRVNGYPRRGVARMLGDNPPPAIVAGWLDETGWRMTLPSRPGYFYVMDASADLVTWTSLSTNVASAFTLEMIDPSATNCPTRFYRVRCVAP